MEETRLLNLHDQIRNPINSMLGYIQILYCDKNLTHKEYEQIVSTIETEMEDFLDSIDSIIYSNV